MPEHEAAQAVAAFAANAITAFTVYISIVFGYLTVAYLIADRLSRFQAVAISGMFVAATASCIGALVANVQAYGAILANAQTPLDDVQFLLDPSFWSIFMSTMLVAGIGVSLHFMHDIRRRAKEQAE